jgi:small subunit ribosomal protein S6
MSATTTRRSYELTYILGERTHQPDAQAKAKEMAAAIAGLGGAVTREELWGRRELAYMIKQNRTGFYTTLWFDLDAAKLQALQRLIRFDESIIRSLITIAVEYSHPGSLAPVQPETKEKVAATTAPSKDEKASAEAMLRMSAGASKKADFEEDINLDDELPEEERLKKLDEKLGELLQEDEASESEPTK